MFGKNKREDEFGTVGYVGWYTGDPITYTTTTWPPTCDCETVDDRLDDIEAQLRQMIKNQKYQQIHNELVNNTLRRLEEDYRLRQNQEMGSRKNNASAKRSNKGRTTKKDN